MKKTILLILLLYCFKSFSQTKTIHVFVALCDNEFQGIVPVPKKLGNGKDPKLNLYWGAMYGVKSLFKYKAKEWKLLKIIKSDNPLILERIVFKHTTKDVYMLADAYDGEHIKTCTENFLKASNNQNPEKLSINKTELNFGGNTNLVAYIGHDGLMDFNVNISYKKTTSIKKDVIILACYSRSFFSAELKKANANPLLWTTHLMAPEAYTLQAAIKGWINNETNKQVDERAAQAYNKYQKCGIKGARNLFTTGFKK